MDKKEYFIGLDCGTDSVGFAVTDTEYNLLKFNGKTMWGSHLFDAAQTAEQRRTARTARRRLKREKQRIEWVQEMFADAVSEIDPVFFIRLNDSFYKLEDKTTGQRNILFDDNEFKVSLRTYEPLDASKICKLIGGGGHRGAAGATVKGTLEDVKKTVLDAVKTVMEEAYAGSGTPE